MTRKSDENLVINVHNSSYQCWRFLPAISITLVHPLVNHTSASTYFIHTTHLSLISYLPQNQPQEASMRKITLLTTISIVTLLMTIFLGTSAYGVALTTPEAANSATHIVTSPASNQVSNQSPLKPLLTNPVAEYRFEKCAPGYPASTSDHTGNLPDGVLKNNATITNDGDGQIHRAYSSNGDNGDHLWVIDDDGGTPNDESDDQLLDNTLDIVGDLTISAWINITSYKSEIIVSRSHDGEFWFGMRWDGDFTYAHSGHSAVDSSGSRVPTDGQWHQVGLVRTGSGSNFTLEFYIDGVLADTQAYNYPISTSDRPLEIGSCQIVCGGYNFDGKIDEVKIFNSAATSQEMSTIYTNESSGKNYDGTQRCPLDWGDLPDSFATDKTDDGGEGTGPSHFIGSNLYLGSCIDVDTDGQPDAHAGAAGSGSGNGDDGNTGSATTGSCANAGDDEDGIKLSTPLIAGNQACFKVTAHNATTAPVNIYAWVDWNGDGNFGAGSTVDTDEAFVLGTVPASTDWTDHEVCTTVPAAATFDGGETHMRFRLTSDTLSGPDWGGAASDGEVEDYYQDLACAGNFVWDDTNGSTPNVQDGSDTGLSGVEVRMVWAGPDGVIDTSASDTSAQNDDVIYTATTDSNGVYNFCGLTPGNKFKMQIHTPPSATSKAVTADQGGDENKDSDGQQTSPGNPVEGPEFDVTSPINMPTNENGNQDNPGSINNFPDAQDNLQFDFGFQQTKVAIGDRVWADDDKNGAMNGAEAGIDSVTVQLYKDADGDGICEPGGDDGSPISTTTTSGDGYYQFLDLEPSDGNDPKTNYCVVIPKSGIPSQYKASSKGWTSDPDTTDEGSGQGDDAYPSGSYVVTRPLTATLEGQTGSDAADAPGYSDKSSYFTVDFGFHTDADPANAVGMAQMQGQNQHSWWLLSILLLLASALTLYIWQHRRAM
jgi:hypothetical protein